MLATSSASNTRAAVSSMNAAVALDCNMDATIERECSALGSLFQQIIQDMKNGTPLWEDLISKATKLHTCLKAAILAISAYLEAFQKIADAATSARGATREIGTALTRICLRHKAVETRVKSFTNAIMDCLVLPLQDKLEDWKKSLVYLDKEHAKEYKKARSELKKKSSDTLRLQKKNKVRKGLQQQQIYGTLPHGVSQTTSTNASSDLEFGRLLESSAAVVHEKRQTLEETERKAVRMALLEERGRFCQFAKFLKPVLDEEIAMLMEMTHLQEVAEQLEKHTASPQHLPPASEQVITDLKGRDPSQWSLATPPSSPSLSLGSRKSSVCSISSLTSSSSGSCKSHPSPSAGHPSSAWYRSAAQQPINGMVTLRYHRSINSGSRDSGFTSLQETLYSQPVYRKQVSLAHNDTRPSTTSTWPDLQREDINAQSNVSDDPNERPHTISTAYEKGHQRPALSVYTFQCPEQSSSQPASPVSGSSSDIQVQNSAKVQMQRKNSGGSIGRERPPIPNRCSSLERPSVPARIDSMADCARQRVDSPVRAKAKLPLPASIPAHVAREIASHQPHLFQQPMYVNMHELANLAASKAQEMHPPPPPPSTLAADPNVTESKQIHTTSIMKSDVGESSTGIVQRRNSLQQAGKPSPPTRRVSAGVVENHDDRASTHSDDLDNLPPPPAFLLEGSSPPSASGSPAMQRRSMSVSETVRTLTELRHTPASPSLLRRKIAAQAQAHAQAHAQAVSVGDEKALARASDSSASAVMQIACCAMERASMAISGSHGSHCGGSHDRHSSPDTKSMMNMNETTNVQVQGGPGGVAQSFMAVLSAKLTGSVSLGTSNNEGSAGNSPKPSRKGSSQVQQQQQQQQQPIQQNQQHQQAHRNSKTPNEFLENLNAKLAQQQRIVQQQQQSGISLRSASVRRMMANRVPILDPLQVRDSLMDQIRRGTSLRKTTGPINDRSAPKIY